MALIPTSSPREFTRAPPELPALIAASVWMKDSTPLAYRLLALALTMPAVTVEVRLKGFPTARTHSPSFKRSLSPIVIVGKSLPSIFTRAKSEFSSVPMILPLYSRLSFSFTRISSALATTWLFVTMYPSLDMITPDPEPLRGGVCIWRCCPPPPLLPKKSPKNSSKGSLCWTVRVSPFCVTLIYTTEFTALSAAPVKSTSPAGALMLSGACGTATGSLACIALIPINRAAKLTPTHAACAAMFNLFFVIAFIVFICYFLFNCKITVQYFLSSHALG